MNNRVSILIPLYNASEWIEETIHSALNQTYTNIEIIIVDDESTDNSYHIAKQFESEIVQVYQQKNKGACAARNLAFEKSTGSYIQYLDADDLLSPNKIETQLALLKNNKNSISNCKWGRFYNGIDDVVWSNQSIDRNYSKPINWLIDSWNDSGMAQTSVWLTPRYLIKEAGIWNDKLIINQDGEFFSRVLMQASSIEFCEQAKVYYRSGNINSISQGNQSKSKAKSLLTSYQLYQNNVSSHLDKVEVRKALGNNFLNFMYQQHISFPKFAEIAAQDFEALNVGKMWPVGGEKFKQIANIIGFKYALNIKKITS